MQALLVLCCVLPAVAAEGDAKKKKRGGDDESKRQPMPHHSFSVPMEYNSLLDDWSLSGASLFERERLLLHPGVPELHGFAWAKSRMLTDDFGATFQFRVASGSEGSKPPEDQGFAFWYVQDNMANIFNESVAIKGRNWGVGLRDQGMAFIGNKGRFNGFATVFSSAKQKQQVSLVTNDGTKELAYDTDIPSANTKEFEFRNTMNAAQVQIRVNKKSIKGFFKQSPSLAWQPCFDFEASDAVKPGGYIGFSAWSGSTGEGRISDLVSLVGLDVSNYDETSIGEDMQDVSTQIQDAYKEMLTDDKRHFADQKSQTEHMVRLVSMVEDHMKIVGPAEDKLYQEMQVLSKRMGALGEDCGTLVKEARLLLKDKTEDAAKQHDHKSNVEAMKNDIIGLRRALVKESVNHRSQLDAVQKNVAEVKQKSLNSDGGAKSLSKIASQAEDLERTVSSRGSQMSYMLFAMVFAIVGIGAMMFNRMQYYEKKHFI